MSLLCGFPRPRLPDHNDNLMLGVLYGESATLQPLADLPELVPVSISPRQTKGQRRTHQIIESVHLLIYRQLFSDLEYFVILLGMRQAGERAFPAILPGRRQEYDV